MSGIQNFVDVTFKLPEWIKKGLMDGTFAREGGVVRNGSGEIVTFLRESSGLSQELSKGNLPSSPLLSSQISSLQSLSTAALGMQVLNLGISAIGFVVIASKLNKIQADLQKIHKKLDEILVEIQWMSRRQDLEMLGKMKGALEIADAAILASSTDLRRQELTDARSRLIESANLSKQFLDDMISTKKYLLKPDLFDLCYRTWTCSRIALVQCELFLNENSRARRSIQGMHEENEEVYKTYLHPLQNFDENPISLLRMSEESRRTLKKVKEIIPNTSSQITSYRQEIDFVQRNGLSWEEWKDAGDSEEPKLIFLVPREENHL